MGVHNTLFKPCTTDCNAPQHPSILKINENPPFYRNCGFLNSLETEFKFCVCSTPQMLNALKKVFERKLEAKGLLMVQGDPFPDITIRLEKENIHLENFDPAIIPISTISEFQIKDDSFIFVEESRKFVFKSKGIGNIFKKFDSQTSIKAIFTADKTAYYTYNTETRQFEKHKQLCIVKIFFDQNYYLRIEDDLSIKHYEQISTDTQYYIDPTNFSFVWSIYNKGKFHTFCVEFADNIQFLEFSSKYPECCYKSVNQDGNFKYFENMAVANCIRNKPDANIPEDEETDWMSIENEKTTPNSLKKSTSFNQDNGRNEHLVVGKDLVFVGRGSSIGVFDIEDEDLKFRTHIQNVLNDPQKIITHSQNQNLLVMDRNQRNELQVLDLSRGEVIERWDVKEDMNDYFDGVKYNDEGTLVGATDYSLFRIDPRMKDKVVEKQTYKTKNEFSCGIATERGDVAVASKKGDLRLYDKISKRAKSLLPGFGDEILGIDSSRDGSMILCTCKNYILVFTACTDYSKPLGKEKPTPKRLQLKPQHLSQIQDEVSFKPAKFDQDDSVIVTSTGKFVVKWRVCDVKNGQVYDYSLKGLQDMIVDENFIFKGDDIVVALPNDVRKVKEEELRRPR